MSQQDANEDPYTLLGRAQHRAEEAEKKVAQQQEAFAADCQRYEREIAFRSKSSVQQALELLRQERAAHEKTFADLLAVRRELSKVMRLVRAACKR